MKKLLFISALLFPLIFVCSFSQYGKWTELHPTRSHNENFFYPKYRSGAGMAKLIEGKVLLFGGNGGGKRNNDTWIFDLELNTWIKIETLHTPPPRVRHKLAQLINGKVLLFGGESGQDIIYNDTWIFDFNTMDWQNMNPEKHPSSRYAFGMSELSEGKAIIFGGDLLTNSSGYHYGHETWIYNYWDNIWREYEYITEFTPISRADPGLAQLSEGKVLMFGGYISIELNDTWIFDEEQSKWIQILPSNSPDGLDGMAFCQLTKNYILLNGGSNGNEVGNDSTWIFSFKDTNWYNFGNSEGIGFRGFHNLAQIENGKAILTSYQAYDDTWLFELDSIPISVTENPKKQSEIKTYINTTNELILDYYLTESGKAEIEIFNINGICVFKSEKQHTQNGWNREIIPVDKLPLGFYFIRVHAGTELIMDKFLVD